MIVIPAHIAAAALRKHRERGDMRAPLIIPGYSTPEKPGEVVISADPVSITIAAAAAFTASTGIIVSATAFAALSFAVTTAITVGGSLLLSTAASAIANSNQRNSFADRGGGVGASPNAPEVRLNTRQETPARRKLYGEILVGGSLFFEECKPPYYYQGFLLGDGPLGDLKGVFNTQVPVETQINSPLALQAIGGVYSGRWWGAYRQGFSNQAMDPILDVDFPNLSNEFRQRQVATLVSKAHYGSDFAQFQALWGSAQRPNILLQLQGSRVYDPRDATQILPTNPDDPDDLYNASLTWKYSDVAALCQADYLWWSEGGRIPLGKINWDEVAKSANWDEGSIGTRAGPQITRHTLSGVVTASQQPLRNLQALLTANAGFICRSQGKVWPQSSRPLEPLITINDEMIVGGIDFRRRQPKLNLLNRVYSRFIDPRQEWATVDGPVLDEPELQEEDGDVYEGTVEFSYTANQSRAQRLMQMHFKQSRLNKQLRLSVSVDCLGLEAGQVVRVDLDILPRANGLYRVSEVGFLDGFTALELVLSEYDPSIDTDWYPRGLDMLPVMSSNSLPTPWVAAASINDTSNAWRMFDGQFAGGTGWRSVQTVSPVSIGQVTISAVGNLDIPVKGYTVTALQGSLSDAPRDWIFYGEAIYGSNVWTTLDTQNNVTWFDGETKYFEIADYGEFQRFAWNISETISGTAVAIRQLRVHNVPEEQAFILPDLDVS